MGREKRAELEGVSNIDRAGSDSDKVTIDVGNDGHSNRREILITASSSLLVTHQLIAACNNYSGIRLRIPAASIALSSKRANHHYLH